jgi:hypothetical protein
MDPLPLYAPALIERDAETGQFWHPHLPFPGGADAACVEYSDAMAEQGDWELVDWPADLHACDGSAAFWQALRDWNPAPPAGDGWQLAAIAVTDAGPRAWFVRPHPALQPVAAPAA